VYRGVRSGTRSGQSLRAANQSREQPKREGQHAATSQSAIPRERRPTATADNTAAASWNPARSAAATFVEQGRSRKEASRMANGPS
jgi:hypothetical protein